MFISAIFLSALAKMSIFLGARKISKYFVNAGGGGGVYKMVWPKSKHLQATHHSSKINSSSFRFSTLAAFVLYRGSSARLPKSNN